VNDLFACSARFFPVSGQGSPSLTSHEELKIGGSGLVLSQKLRRRFTKENQFRKLIRSQTPSPTVVKDEQDAVHSSVGASMLGSSIVGSISHVAHDVSVLLT